MCVSVRGSLQEFFGTESPLGLTLCSDWLRAAWQGGLDCADAKIGRGWPTTDADSNEYGTLAVALIAFRRWPPLGLTLYDSAWPLVKSNSADEMYPAGVGRRGVPVGWVCAEGA